MAVKQFQRFSDRFFQLSPLYTRPGWYIKLRENTVVGPYPCREAAQAALLTMFGIADPDGEIISQVSESTVLYSDNSRSEKD